MKVVLSVPHRLIKTSKNYYYTRGSSIIPSRYLEVFDELEIFVRVETIDAKEFPGKEPLNRPNLTVYELPYYVGPLEYLKKYFSLMKKATQKYYSAIRAKSAFILQVPSVESGLLSRLLIKNRIPYGVEVVGSARDSMNSLQLNCVKKQILKKHAHCFQRKQCSNASAAVYVTKQYLQTLYPCNGWSLDCPDIVLNDGDYITESVLSDKLNKLKDAFEGKRAFRISHVGSMSASYKGQAVLLEAVRKCRNMGIDLEVSFVGDGKCRKEFEQKAKAIDLEEYVTFCGLLPTFEDVQALLDKSDIFVFPSFTEGLPRAVIEAMARGLPCICSDVGGIMELVDDCFLVPPKDSDVLAEKIHFLLSDYSMLEKTAWRNQRKSRQYNYDIISLKRGRFYEKVRKLTHDYYNMKNNVF